MPATSKYPGVIDTTDLDVSLVEDAVDSGSTGSRFNITVPWSPQVYFTVRGAENFHIYLWILKDLAWSQSWTEMAWLFGLSAISWCLVLVYHAIDSRCFMELYMLVVMILWLSGNFVWMAGGCIAHLSSLCIHPYVIH
jgi:hypothetical protein